MIYTYGHNGLYYALQPLGFDNFGFQLTPTDTTPPRARHPIGVNQPPNGGDDYPFVRPSPNIHLLLGDFYLSYSDDTCSYVSPFRIEWMYGFGTRQYSESGSEVDPLPGYPTPTHEYDILVKDANGATVFDSTMVGIGDDSDNVAPFKYSEWYSRYVVIEWTNRSKDIVCRCTKFIGWDSYSTDYQEYDEYIVPAYSTGTVTSVANLAGKTRLTIAYDQADVRLQKNDVIYVKGTDVPGYNVAHTVVAVDPSDITKLVTDITYSQVITTAGLWRDPSGILDPRTYNKLPLRLRSITVRGVYGDLGTFLQGDISLRSNYNIELETNPSSIGFIDFNLAELGFNVGDAVIPGSRLVNRIAINSEPGLGAGAFQKCGDFAPDRPLRRLNTAKGDDKHNITLDSGEDCIRLQRPVALVDDCPRQFEFDGTATPSPETGAHTNRFINDCSSCCDCDYFARTYQGLKRQWNAYQVIADDSIEARDQFQLNVSRWRYQKECRESNPIILVVRILPNCTVDVAVTYGNTSACCLVNVHMRLTFQYNNGIHWVTYPSEDLCDKGILRYLDVKTGHSQGNITAVDPIGNFPVVDLLADYLATSSTFQVAAKLCFPGCIPGSKVRVHSHIWWEHAIRPHNVYCDYPPRVDTSEIINVWQTANMDLPPYDITYAASSPVKDLNDTSAFCLSNGESCERPPDCYPTWME